ncbi:hypothetical protein JI750_08960 [Flavobacterium sp. GN10]|uniref:Uncharacterized protein n=1 Tax=Flavobacterium tagetis TaxID=2801336 RepID=A0ABS1KC47_9FLAO|nr:hypothetical protein [Flavobacterium tagetis]MBL0737010.1 hypothetical protein [Flavobacterium tagetis]
MSKKINKSLNDSLKSITKINIGDKITAGRTIQTPSSTLKPVIKPKEKK